MTKPSRGAFPALARAAAAVLAMVIIGAGTLAAQGTTGKIEGTVRDQSGAPISGAQVFTVGAAFTAVTNEQGYYFLNNVPAGVMVVRAQYVGYQPAEARNVRVFAGQTLTVNLALERRVLEVEAVTVRVERIPIVPRDQVTSKPIVEGEIVQALPADNVTEVLRLQPGVVEGARGLTLRGGRPGEAGTYLDGVLVRNFSASFRGTGSDPTVRVGTNALQEASITTGAVGAEFGEAQSGIISYVTRAGGPTWRRSLSYSTDDVAGETFGQGTNRVEASIGGPLARNFTLFVATTLQGSQSPRLGKGWEDVPLYVLNGVDTTVTVPLSPGSATSDSQVVALPGFTQYSQGARRPDDASDAYTFDTKLQYTYGTGSRFSATYHRSRDQDRSFRGSSLFNPASQSGFRRVSSALILNWAQNLSSSSERALFLEGYLSWQRDRDVSGLLDPAWFEAHQDPFASFTFSSFKFVTDLDDFPVDDRLIRNLRVNNCQTATGGRCAPFLDRNDLEQTGAYRTNPYGITAGRNFFPSAGVGTGSATFTQETRLTGRVNVDWQANRYHRVRFGGDFLRAAMSNYTSSAISRIFMDAYRETPVKMGLYAQDRLDLGDVVIEAGLRLDRLDSRIWYPRTPSRLYTDPLRNPLPDGSPNLAAARTAEDTVVAQRCAAFKTAADTTAWSTCNYFQAEARSVLSPTLRVAFPVTDRTGFRLSYSHQVQTPDFNLLATANNTDMSVTNTNDIFARDLDFGKSIIFEFGIRHAFSEDMVLDVSAYNKDKVSDITARIMPIFDPFRGETQNVNILTNADFGNSRGFDVSLLRRFGTIFNGQLAYTYQTARSTGSDPFEYINTLGRQISAVTGDRAPPPQAMLTTRDNRTHTIAGSLALNFPHGWGRGTLAGALLQDAGAFATFRFASGLPYTRIENAGGGTRGPGNGFGLVGTGLETLNSSSMPWIRNVDLRLTRGFNFGGRDLTVFADFRNLFNWTTLTSIFAETGDVVNGEHRERVISPVRVTLQSDAGALWKSRGGVLGIELVDVRGTSTCPVYPYGRTGSAGVPDCIMLQRAEARFGNGDGFFDVNEQERAFNAWYDLFNGPQTFRGPGLNVRVGFELNF